MNSLLNRTYSYAQSARRHLLAVGITSLIAVTMLLTACQAEEDEGKTAPDGNKIAFQSSVMSALSRGTPITKNNQTSLLSAGVYACSTGANSFDEATSTPDYMKNQLLERSQNGSLFTEWTYTPTKYWPATGNKLTFLAYSPHSNLYSGLTLSQQLSTAYPKMDFAVDATIANQVDLLIADPAKDCDRINGTTVSLNMQHALTLISFSAAVKEAETSGMLRVNKITVANVLSSGNTLLKTPIVWTNPGASTSYALSVENGMLTGTALTTTMALQNTTNGFLLLMPQPFNDEQAKIIVEYSDAAGVGKIHEEDFAIYYTDVAWEPGRSINYQILLDAKKVKISAQLAPWGDLKSFNGGDNISGLLPWE